jgi:hypothetical protein
MSTADGAHHGRGRRRRHGERQQYGTGRDTPRGGPGGAATGHEYRDREAGHGDRERQLPVEPVGGRSQYGVPRGHGRGDRPHPVGDRPGGHHQAHHPGGGQHAEARPRLYPGRQCPDRAGHGGDLGRDQRERGAGPGDRGDPAGGDDHRDRHDTGRDVPKHPNRPGQRASQRGGQQDRGHTDEREPGPGGAGHPVGQQHREEGGRAGHDDRQAAERPRGDPQPQPGHDRPGGHRSPARGSPLTRCPLAGPCLLTAFGVLVGRRPLARSGAPAGPPCDGDITGRDGGEHGGPAGRAQAGARGEQGQGRLRDEQGGEARPDEMGGQPVPEGDERGDRAGDAGVRLRGECPYPGEVDVPGGVPVEDYQQQPQRGEGLGGAGEPAQQRDRRHGQGQYGHHRENRGPADHAEVGPRHGGEDDGGAAQQHATQHEQHVLNGPAGRLGTGRRFGGRQRRGAGRYQCRRPGRFPVGRSRPGRRDPGRERSVWGRPGRRGRTGRGQFGVGADPDPRGEFVALPLGGGQFLEQIGVLLPDLVDRLPELAGLRTEPDHLGGLRVGLPAAAGAAGGQVGRRVAGRARVRGRVGCAHTAHTCRPGRPAVSVSLLRPA